MGFLDGIKAGLSAGAGAATTKAVGSFGASLPNFGTSGVFGLSTSMLQRGSSELLGAYKANPTLRKVVNLIANQLAAGEYYLINTRKKGAKKSVKSMQGVDPANIIYEHPYLEWLYRGSPALPGPAAIKLSAVYYLLKGEFFWLLVPGADGAPSWMLLPPTWVQEVPGFHGGSYKVSLGQSTKVITVPPESMVWMRDPDVLDPYGRGNGVGDSLRDELDSDEYAASLMRTVLANKGLMDGILSFEGETSPESKRALRLEFERQHRGTGNAGKVLVVDRTVKYTPLSHAFNELRLLELRAQEKEFIEETFCVPPELFGKVSGSNRATITEAMNIFARNTLVPYHTAFCLTLSSQALPLFDRQGSLVQWFESPVPEDLETRKALMAASPQSFTSNEIREVAELPAKAWGNVRYVPGNLLEVPAIDSGKQGRKALSDSTDTDDDQKKSLK